MESHIYDKYIYGDKEYAKLLEVLRAHLCNEFGMEYGIIIFCRYNPEEEYTESNKVKVFPINPDIVNRHFPVNDEIRRNFLEAINRDRKSNELYFIKQFRTGSDCLKITIEDKEELLQHSKDFINRNSWGDSYISITNSGELNILDQLFFKSNQPEFDVIPIPVLTSPAILLVIPYNFLDENKKKEVYKTISESIHTYLFNKLINEINTDITISGINNKFSLIKSYLKVISEVIIPINYSFANEETRCFDWYGNYDTLRGYQFKLNLGGEDISFMLPNFHWVDGNLISDHKYYNVKENQFKETIESIYKLIYKNWEAVRNVEKRALAAYKETIKSSAIKPALINDAIKQMQMIEGQIQIALAIELDQFTEMINSVSKNVVICKYIYNDDDVVMGYTISYNDDVVYENRFKNGYHFGYDCLKEIIESDRELIWSDFTIIEDVKSVLNKRSNITLNGDNNDINLLTESNNDQIADLLIEYCNQMIKLCSRNTIEEFEYYYISNSDVTSCANLIALFKKDIDNCYSKCNSYNVNSNNEYYKLKKLKIVVDGYYKKFCKKYTDFKNEYDKSDSCKNEDLLKLRELVGNNPSSDNKIKHTISRNVSQVIKGLCKVGHNEFFKNHFTEAGLYWEDEKWKTIDRFHYNKKNISSKYLIEWKFE